MSIERDFDTAFVAGMASREKQIQQNYRPIIAVHKWFARRPGTLFRALILSEFGSAPLRERFFEANQFAGVRVGDPFMGGGTPLIEANRLGCDIIGYDINPMAHWIVRQEIESLDLNAYQSAALGLVEFLEAEIGDLYRTRCLECSLDAPVKYFLWVKVGRCESCGRDIDLFPGYVVSENHRHPRNVFVCRKCGCLTETDELDAPGDCASCGQSLVAEGPARRKQCACPACGSINRYPNAEIGPPRHRLFAIEYHCHCCKPNHAGRFFKKPDESDLSRLTKCQQLLNDLDAGLIPSEPIPPGDETDRLLRWGYRFYREMFNERQLIGLVTSARYIANIQNERMRNALATNLSDLVRYQNMLCRYDNTVLKSVDIFSVHGFPVNLIQCESNLIGISSGSPDKNLFGDRDGGGNVGSGGWRNIIDKYTRAKAYCERPFEVRQVGRRRLQVPIDGEWIGDVHARAPENRRNVALLCQSSTLAEVPPATLDIVLTDPPYFKNVQYAELIDFCYVWLRRLLASSEASFELKSTRSANELTGNETMERDLHHFATGLSQVYVRMARALKPGRPFVFTYHNNDLAAYYPIAVAILDAGLLCTAVLPCPAEMNVSIHILNTDSSVIDSIFVCRLTDATPRPSESLGSDDVASLVERDCEMLRVGGVNPTAGDVRCIVFGHLIRAAVRRLRPLWTVESSIEERLAKVESWIDSFGGHAAVAAELDRRMAGQTSSGRQSSLAANKRSLVR